MLNFSLYGDEYDAVIAIAMKNFSIITRTDSANILVRNLRWRRHLGWVTFFTRDWIKLGSNNVFFLYLRVQDLSNTFRFHVSSEINRRKYVQYTDDLFMTHVSAYDAKSKSSRVTFYIRVCTKRYNARFKSYLELVYLKFIQLCELKVDTNWGTWNCIRNDENRWQSWKIKRYGVLIVENYAN